MVNGKQYAMAWYVHDIKISHQEDKVCTQIANITESRFGNLTRSQCKKHTFLGMDIELLGNRKVAISMPQHLKEALDLFSEVLMGDLVNPANSMLSPYVRRRSYYLRRKQSYFTQ